MEGGYYRIEKAARMAGISKRAIRYYEDIGLVTPKRSEAGYRLYTGGDIETIIEIKNLRLRLGMSTDEVGKFLGLKKKILSVLEGGETSRDEIKDTRDKIGELLVFVAEQEEVLKRIKMSCQNYLKSLDLKEKQLEI